MGWCITGGSPFLRWWLMVVTFDPWLSSFPRKPFLLPSTLSLSLKRWPLNICVEEKMKLRTTILQIFIIGQNPKSLFIPPVKVTKMSFRVSFIPKWPETQNKHPNRLFWVFLPFRTQWRTRNDYKIDVTISFLFNLSN